MPGEITLERSGDWLPPTPGGPPSVVTLIVSNRSHIVDQVSLRALGPDGSWCTISPPTVGLFPDSQAQLQVTVTAPAGVSAGPRVIEVIAASGVNPTETATLPLAFEVQTIESLSIVLDPAAQRASGWATYSAHLQNAGNTQLHLRLSAADESHALQFALDP